MYTLSEICAECIYDFQVNFLVCSHKSMCYIIELECERYLGLFQSFLVMVVSFIGGETRETSH